MSGQLSRWDRFGGCQRPVDEVSADRWQLCTDGCSCMNADRGVDASTSLSTSDAQPVGVTSGADATKVFCRSGLELRDLGAGQRLERWRIRVVSSLTLSKISRRCAISPRILRSAYITVVWSRPKACPIFGRDRSVSSRHRYMAIWRDWASALVLPGPRSSSTVVSKYSAVAAMIVAMLICMVLESEIRSRNTISASALAMALLFSEAKAVTRMRAPSSSRM